MQRTFTNAFPSSSSPSSVQNSTISNKRRRTSQTGKNDSWLCVLFQYLQAPFVLNHCSLVCKRWCAIVNQEHVWRDVCANYWPSLRIVINDVSENVQRNFDMYCSSPHFWRELFRERYLRDHYLETELKQVVQKYSDIITTIDQVKLVVDRIQDFRNVRPKSYVRGGDTILDFLFDSVVYDNEYSLFNPSSFHVEGTFFDQHMKLHTFSAVKNNLDIGDLKFNFESKETTLESLNQLRKLLSIEDVRLIDLYKLINRILVIHGDIMGIEHFLEDQEPLPSMSLVGNTLEVPMDVTMQSLATNQFPVIQQSMDNYSSQMLQLDMDNLSQQSQLASDFLIDND
jgi:hypothetical protein